MSSQEKRLQRMLAASLIEAVPVNMAFARTMLAQAQTHLETALVVCESDPNAAYALQCDAVRKALAAVLLGLGYRVKARGGHAGLYDALRLQLGEADRAAIRPFERLRKRRHQVEYLTEDVPSATADEVVEAVSDSRRILTWAVEKIDSIEDPNPPSR